MKNLASPSFFRTFELLLAAGNPGSKLSLWNYDGVEWARDRYSVTGRSPGRRGWCLMVAKEHWWAGARPEAIKTAQWARPLSGQRKDIIEWFRKHEAALDRGTPP